MVISLSVRVNTTLNDSLSPAAELFFTVVLIFPGSPPQTGSILIPRFSSVFRFRM